MARKIFHNVSVTPFCGCDIGSYIGSYNFKPCYVNCFMHLHILNKLWWTSKCYYGFRGNKLSYTRKYYYETNDILFLKYFLTFANYDTYLKPSITVQLLEGDMQRTSIVKTCIFHLSFIHHFFCVQFQTTFTKKKTRLNYICEEIFFLKIDKA